MIKTIVLTGGECEVSGLCGKNTVIINRGDNTIYASASAGVEPEADGVIAIPAGTRDGLHSTGGTVYLLGSGKVELRGTDYSVNGIGGSGGTGSLTAGSISADTIDGLFS